MAKPQERSACGEKVQYVTREAARNAIIHLKTTFGDKTVMQAYKCRYCGFFHIGHETRGGKRKAIEAALEQAEKESRRDER